MKEKLNQYKNQAIEMWYTYLPKQRWSIVAAFFTVLIVLSLIVFWSQRSDYVPLYENLSAAEAGEIMEQLEAEGIAARVSDDLRTIFVPSRDSSRLKVELAHQGIPRSGNINYSIFSENMGLGMTDRQFDVIERDAMQNELRYLMEQIDGIDQARVMISRPQENIFLARDEQSSTASVVVQTSRTTNLSQSQINGLYHLISRSIPDLPVENIVIMDQDFQELAISDQQEESSQPLALYQQQREIKRDIEMDIQRDIQRMLSAIIGPQNVVVSVYANVDFSQENREEHLVTPVNEELNEGIAVSIERIQETFEGQGAPEGGVVGTGEQDIANYPGLAGGGDSTYELTEERINNEINRIYRQIETSPYQITDLTINAGVDPIVVDLIDPANLPIDLADLDNQEALQQAREVVMADIIENVENILLNVVNTSLSSTGVVFAEEELNQRITVFASPFAGRDDFQFEQPSGLLQSAWFYALVGGLLVLAFVAVAIIISRRRKAAEEEALALESAASFSTEGEEEDLSTVIKEDQTLRKVERFVRQNPREFTKLLRSWMTEE